MKLNSGVVTYEHPDIFYFYFYFQRKSVEYREHYWAQYQLNFDGSSMFWSEAVYLFDIEQLLIVLL